MKNIEMRYLIDPGDRLYVKVYGFLSFATNMGKNLSNKYNQKLLDSAEKSTTDAIKICETKKLRSTHQRNHQNLEKEIESK